jgi:hypothetical protein
MQLGILILDNRNKADDTVRLSLMLGWYVLGARHMSYDLRLKEGQPRH